MTRRMTPSEATDLIEQVFEMEPDHSSAGLIELYVAGMDVGQARQDVESYLAFIPGDFDPDSIQITPDNDDESDMDLIRVVIRTEAHHAHA